MMLLLKQLIVSRELAERMQKLGFPQHTLFSWYIRTDCFDAVGLTHTDNSCLNCHISRERFIRKIAAPTSAEINYFLPDNWGFPGKLDRDKDNGQWFWHYDNNGLFKDVVTELEAEASGEIWCWLKENGLISWPE